MIYFRKFRKLSIIFEYIFSSFYSYTATQLGKQEDFHKYFFEIRFTKVFLKFNLLKIFRYTVYVVMAAMVTVLP